MWFSVTMSWCSIGNSRDCHQAIPTIKFKAEGISTIADEQWRGLLPRFLAAHPIGVTDAMVAGH